MTIVPYTTLNALLVTNTEKSITGDNIGDFADSAMGVRAYIQKTTDFTLTEDSDVVEFFSGTAREFTLPPCSSTRVGKVITIHKGNTTTALTITADGSDTFNNDGGATSIVLMYRYSYVTLLNTGTYWLIIGQRGLTSGLIYVGTTGATVHTSVAEATLLSIGSGLLTLPAYFYRQYTVLRVRASGVISDTSTPNLTIKVKHGSTVLVSSGAVALAGVLADAGWTLDVDIICRTTGASADMMTQGVFRYGPTNSLPLASTAIVDINTANSQAFDITVQWGTSSASNTITLHNCVVEVLR